MNINFKSILKIMRTPKVLLKKIDKNNKIHHHQKYNYGKL